MTFLLHKKQTVTRYFRSFMSEKYLIKVPAQLVKYRIAVSTKTAISVKRSGMPRNGPFLRAVGTHDAELLACDPFLLSHASCALISRPHFDVLDYLQRYVLGSYLRRLSPGGHLRCSPLGSCHRRLSLGGDL